MIVKGSAHEFEDARKHYPIEGRQETLGHFVCRITTPDNPLCEVEPGEFFADPAGVLDSFVPGVGGLLAEGAVSVPAHPEWYTIERARRVLGYYPRHYYKVGS